MGLAVAAHAALVLTLVGLAGCVCPVCATPTIFELAPVSWTVSRLKS